jgi:hypothetical protein
VGSLDGIGHLPGDTGPGRPAAVDNGCNSVQLLVEGGGRGENGSSPSAAAASRAVVVGCSVVVCSSLTAGGTVDRAVVDVVLSTLSPSLSQAAVPAVTRTTAAVAATTMAR